MKSIRRGRLFDHVELKVKNIDVSKKFYRPVIESLGLSISFENMKSFSVDEFFVTESESPSNTVHLAFRAPHPAAVKMFYDTAIQNGGMCNGAPGERNLHTNYYSAYVLDPDGNNIEAVFHDPNSLLPTILNSHI